MPTVNKLAKSKTLAAVLLALGFLGAACGSDDATVTASSDTETESGESNDEAAAASMVLPTVSGGQIDVGSFEGTDTILWFWAPW